MERNPGQYLPLDKQGNAATLEFLEDVFALRHTKGPDRAPRRASSALHDSLGRNRQHAFMPNESRYLRVIEHYVKHFNSPLFQPRTKSGNPNHNSSIRL